MGKEPFPHRKQQMTPPSCQPPGHGLGLVEVDGVAVVPRGVEHHEDPRGGAAADAGQVLHQPVVLQAACGGLAGGGGTPSPEGWPDGHGFLALGGGDEIGSKTGGNGLGKGLAGATPCPAGCQMVNAAAGASHRTPLMKFPPRFSETPPFGYAKASDPFMDGANFASRPVWVVSGQGLLTT